jgi:hypothetical protein
VEMGSEACVNARCVYPFSAHQRSYLTRRLHRCGVLDIWAEFDECQIAGSSQTREDRAARCCPTPLRWLVSACCRWDRGQDLFELVATKQTNRSRPP